MNGTAPFRRGRSPPRSPRADAQILSNPRNHAAGEQTDPRGYDAVPPTVIESIFSVGWPTPTGT
ncbi:MAG TPA: hypothetical protein VL545_09190, partial [Rhodanobacter sp.]|nr:hypothetical protein [Rhodanobacter sp.]